MTSEELPFRAVFDASPDALLICELDGRILMASDRCSDVFGVQPSELVSRPVEALMPERFRAGHLRLRSRYARAPEPRPMGASRELFGLREDGSELPVEISLSPVEADGRRYVLAAIRDTTERTEAHAATARLAAIVESSDDAIIGATVDGVVTSWNAGAERMYGYGAEEIVGDSISRLVASEDAVDEQRELIRRTVDDGVPRRIETTRRCKDGRMVDVAVNASPVRDRKGRIVGISMIGRDITERNRLIGDLTLRARLLDVVDAAVIATDLSGRVSYWNKGAERLYGWDAGDVIGRPIEELTVGPQDAALAAEIMRAVTESGSWEGTFEVVRSDGSRFPAFVRDVAYRDPSGRPAGVIGVSIDISARVAVERELTATRDFLSAVTENIGEALIVFDRAGRITYANGVAPWMLGYSASELLAANVAELLGAGPERRAELLAGIQPATSPMRSDTHSMHRGDGTWLPVDFTSSPLPEREVAQWVMVVADDTERRAAFNALERELENLGWVGRIEEALRSDLLVLHAQPIVDIGTLEVTHHELLLRMRAPDGSLIPPGQFLPVAEEHGLITEIDRWVIGRGIELASEGVAVAVNLSAATLADPSAPQWIVDRIRAGGADPSCLVFEVTETAFLHDMTAGSALAKALSELGCVLALDDFGTGYGGFTYLKQLDIGMLKIDTEFVHDLTIHEASRHVTQAIVKLGAAFGIKTVAEGVENAETLEALAALGVDSAQGFYLGVPAPVTTADALRAGGR